MVFVPARGGCEMGDPYSEGEPDEVPVTASR